jgi:hypothetical protein
MALSGLLEGFAARPLLEVKQTSRNSSFDAVL